MEILSMLALVMLVLVGYSGGNVLGWRGSAPPPRPVDLLIVGALWAAAFVVRPEFGKWPTIAIGVAAGLFVGTMLATVRRARSAADAESAAQQGRTNSGSLRERWRRFALDLGNYQGRMLMAFFYFGMVTPFALIGGRQQRRIPFGDGPASRWLQRTATAPTLDHARRQF